MVSHFFIWKINVWLRQQQQQQKRQRHKNGSKIKAITKGSLSYFLASFLCKAEHKMKVKLEAKQRQNITTAAETKKKLKTRKQFGSLFSQACRMIVAPIKRQHHPTKKKNLDMNPYKDVTWLQVRSFEITLCRWGRDEELQDYALQVGPGDKKAVMLAYTITTRA